LHSLSKTLESGGFPNSTGVVRPLLVAHRNEIVWWSDLTKSSICLALEWFALAKSSSICSIIFMPASLADITPFPSMA
jgi:hypothetical protein